MSMQPISQGDLNNRFDRMAANWMTYMHTMQEGLLAQMRVDKSDLQQEIAAVREEVVNVREEVATLGEEVTALGEVVTTLDAKVTTLDETVMALDAKVMALGEEVATLREEIANVRAELKQDVANLRGEMVARLAALQKRQETSDTAIAEVKQLLLQILADQREILTNQRDLRQYVDARARDSDAILANAVAQLSEQINDIRRRLPPEAPQG
jgi:chromosome segregation ATPase